MVANNRLKLFERASLRLFTKQTTGTPPSFPAKVKTLGYYPTKTFREDVRSSTERRSGATVGDVIPGYPRGGPKCTRPDRVGWADGIPADSIRTVCRTKTTGSFQRCRDRPDLLCTSRDIVVTD